ncbi:MAG: TAXI family TRAP transporter solute-binding subunit [Candidatus Sedimenticola sp. (ex Thyasira tokunagai)]
MSEEKQHLKDHLNIFGPALLLILFGFALAYQFVQPAPPEQIRIATGGKEGAYYLFGQAYRSYLEQEKITLEVLNSAGSVENIKLLENGEADLAFIQGGLSEISNSDQLISLGSLYYEPIWLFHRKGLEVSRLTDLERMRVAVGAIGSGTHAVATELLKDNGISATNSTLQELSGSEAATALIEGDTDAAFFVASPKSPVVQTLLESEHVILMSFQRADAYSRRHRHLSSVVLPQGVIDLKRNIPQRETVLLAAGANLVAHQNLHPALIDLLLQAAQKIHGGGGWFEEAGQFPNPNHLDFPLSSEAKRFYASGPPFLQRYLPFWAATLVDRLKVMLLPLLALMIPLFKIMPPIYRWRMRYRIYRWYREILTVDRRHNQPGGDIAASLNELARIEDEVSRVSVPLSYTEELYDLRLHIGLVREKLRTLDDS